MTVTRKAIVKGRECLIDFDEMRWSIIDDAAGE
jgi:hypothetical protein